MKTFYSKRIWLNKKNCVSTGSFVAFHGELALSKGGKGESKFIEIGDCDVKVRLHQTLNDKPTDFIAKLNLLTKEINKFVDYLIQAG